jgi:hypothetical protein
MRAHRQGPRVARVRTVEKTADNSVRTTRCRPRTSSSAASLTRSRFTLDSCMNDPGTPSDWPHRWLPIDEFVRWIGLRRRLAMKAPPALRLCVAAGMVLGSGPLDGFAHTADTLDTSSSIAISEAAQILGEGVVGDAQSARPLADPAMVARWEAGTWRYRITSGVRRGQIESEALVPIGGSEGETWERRVGREYTLYLRRTAEGGIVMPTELAHDHKALVHFEPPLSYLIAGLTPGGHKVFDGKMDVYSSRHPATKWYSGRVQATTTYAGMYRVTTPAGTYNAMVIRTEYRIDILSVVSVCDTLYTFYAEGVGKIAEAEHRRISAGGLFSTDTKTGKVLVSFTPAAPPTSASRTRSSSGPGAVARGAGGGVGGADGPRATAM